MGLVVSFKTVSPQELDAACEDPRSPAELGRRDRPGEPGGYLDKAWAGLQFLFDEADLPIDLLADGFVINDDVTVTGWDAQTVQRVAKLLQSTPFAQLARYFDPDEMSAQAVYPSIWGGGDSIGYLRDNYQILVRFFAAAAAAGSAAIMYGPA